MNRKERRAARKSGSPLASPMAATLAAAFRVHQAGHRADAERLYRDVLMSEPANAAALHLLGVLLHQSGQTAEGLSLIGQAVAIEPLNADYQYNFGSILSAAGRFEDAERALRKALVLNPKYTQAHFELGRLHGQAGRWPEAEASFRQVLSQTPSDAAALNNLGMVLREKGEWNEAITLWQRAVMAAPTYPLAHMNLGLAYQRQGQWDEALASLKRARELAPNNAETNYNLAMAELNHGQHEQALQTILAGLDKADSAELRALFVTCLSTTARIPAQDRIRQLVARALREGWSRPEAIAAVAISILKGNPVIANAVARSAGHTGAPLEALGAGGLASIAQDELLIALLKATPVTDVELERVLTLLRSGLLSAARSNDAAAAAEPVLRLSAALAQQGFLNGYVWAKSAQDVSQLGSLQNLVAAALQSGQPVAPQWLTALASYQPLSALPFAAALSQQVTDKPVMAVTPQKPVSIDAYLRRGFPNATMRPIGKTTGLDILIAGSGSGQTAIEMASRHPGSHIAVCDDASDASAMTQRFDVIEATNARIALTQLAALLRPNGVMRLRVHGDTLQQAITSARDFAHAGNYQPDADGLSLLRQNILQLRDDHPARRLTQRPEFYVLAPLHDLIFGEEHTLTLGNAQNLLSDAGLALLGVDVDTRIGDRYRARFPQDTSASDLANWQILDREDSTIPAMSYDLWVQKR